MKILTPIKSFYFGAACVLLLMSGCSCNRTYLNDSSDKPDAVNLTTRFYEDIKHKEFDSTFKFFDKRFFKVASKEKMTEMYKATLEKLGNLDSTRLVDCQIQRVEGTNRHTSYQLIFTNHYSKYTSKEAIQLLSENGGPIKIVSYNINSEGFMK